MTQHWSPDTTNGTWPGPPEIPPHEPYRTPYPPIQPPERSPQPILPTWEEPDPHWADRHVNDLLLNQRVIMLTGLLDEPTTERATRQLLLVDRADHTRPIELRMSCRGADLEASLALAAAIDMTRAPVHAVVSGTVSGPALAVLCAASERAAHRHATFVLAIPHVSAQKSATTVETQADELQRAVDQLIERIATVSGRPGNRVEEDLRSGRVMSAEEARSYGLVSSVL